jgi:LmbE family N-acetylglucosaminyl deacetylase
MKPSASLALALLAATAFAQTSNPPANQTQAASPSSDLASRSAALFTDPANLSGERGSPRTGRELPIDTGTLGLQQLLRQLNTRASILNIVAHPDDEDGGMLTLNARGLGARVADLSLTRGEGGQNAMTGDFEDALGLLRTQELLANDRYTGVSQMFGTEVDFGFSKTKSEAFDKWTHQRVLYDAVRAIRIFRPLVITATFIGEPTDGHGQHQVSGQIAQEAFLTAGDPKVFPELTAEGILPWQPLKMYARVPMGAITPRGLFDYATNQYVPATFTNYVTGEKSTTPPSTDIVIHEGTPDPLLSTCAANPADLPPNLSSLREARGSASLATGCRPLSYIQFSRIGLGLQKSQIGPGVRNAPTGTFDVSYHLYGSCLPNSPTLKLCHLKADQVGITNNPSASGAPYTSLGQSPRKTPQNDPEGPEAHSIAVSDAPTFFDGIDTSLEGIATLAPDTRKAIPLVLKANLAEIAQKIETAEKEVADGHTDNVVTDLSTALTLTDMSIDNLASIKPDLLPSNEREDVLHELRIKRTQLNNAIVLALGLHLDATTPTADAVVGTSPATVETLQERSTLFLDDIHCGLSHGQRNTVTTAAFTHEDSEALASGRELNREVIAPVAFTSTFTRPYFHRDNIETPVYTLVDADLRNASVTPAPLVAWCTLNYRGTDLRLERTAHSAAQPVQIVPPLSISMTPPIALISTRSEPKPTALTVTTRINLPSIKPNVDIISPDNWTALATPQDPALSRPGQLLTIRTRLVPFGMTTTDALPTVVKVYAVVPGSSDREGTDLGYRPIGYGDLPRTNIFTPAVTRFVPVDLILPPAEKRRIAYLPGTGDAIPEALASIGLAPTTLTVDDLTPSNLAKFDTVILGVRTYNAHPDLHGTPTQALLDFARNGGNVLVQYQTPEFTAADAPYPLSLGDNEKVVDETAPVRLLREPDNPAERLLVVPNKITPADFNGWNEERGHGFLSTWDSHYTALTETHDPGVPAEGVLPQAPQRGGLITAQVGKGRWTYVAFALYRQLPEAVPGAFRLFVNLINP